MGSAAIRLAEPNSIGTPVVVPSELVTTSPAYHWYFLGVQAPEDGQGAASWLGLMPTFTPLFAVTSYPTICACMPTLTEGITGICHGMAPPAPVMLPSGVVKTLPEPPIWLAVIRLYRFTVMQSPALARTTSGSLGGTGPTGLPLVSAVTYNSEPFWLAMELLGRSREL